MVTKGRLAYAATCSHSGFGIGLAEENERGYLPMPEYGTFPSWDEASKKANELNAARGLSQEAAWSIVSSSMAAQNRGKK